ncbi:cytoskeletal-regulatory complex EF hand-domain-containing protein [Radiomyces spectabilis]|uniref:cytoskeletal-regulatory complex EF hand-domain-containing protein n=1 Tax=Radiomyces spectabilis TaxID=64574 RepID=UPI00221F6007|nr:cytoskeletal-regulatory complex EF hand-domain-containing protein [Radiomyces spectabilis]KAI8381371.1 cytoskeletal-regulatory complex EF hand-domain-containing protein [Radiomyces spectabilis]
MSAITAAEKQKYAEIFHARGNVNGYMSGQTARDVLLDSNLPANRLERIWDLADIDKDGCLDFEEFCVAMHLTFDCINGAETPMSLPPSLVPSTKAHLVPNGQVYPQATGYQQPMATGYQQPQPTGYQQPQMTGYQQPQPTGYSPYQQPQSTGYQQPQPTGVMPQYTGYSSSPTTVEFSWDMSPQDMTSYQNIYSKYANGSGKVKFGQMEDFYATLGLSRTDLTNAWTLVDVNHTHALTQDQCLVFFHILNQRTRGATIPKDLPPDLHAAFAGEYAADLGDRPGSGSGARKGNSTSMSKSAQLADSYVNRLGVASTSLSSKGSSVKGNKYDEEEMLKRELRELKERVKEAERRRDEAKNTEEDSYESFASRPLRDQFQALYDYKLRQLTDQADVEDKVRKQERDIEAARDAVRRLNRIVDDVRSKKRELEALLEERRLEVQKTMRQLEEERA